MYSLHHGLEVLHSETEAICNINNIKIVELTCLFKISIHLLSFRLLFWACARYEGLGRFVSFLSQRIEWELESLESVLNSACDFNQGFCKMGVITPAVSFRIMN